MCRQEPAPDVTVVDVVIGTARSARAGWIYTRAGTAAFGPGKLVIEGLTPTPGGNVIDGLPGEASGVSALLALMFPRSYGGSRLEIDTATGTARFDEKRGLVHVALPDGRAVAFFASGGRRRPTKETLARDRGVLATAVAGAYGDRLQRSPVENPAVTRALRVLLYVVLPLTAALAVLAILGFSGLLD